jgi:hypothetical protein
MIRGGRPRRTNSGIKGAKRRVHTAADTAKARLRIVVIRRLIGLSSLGAEDF